MQTDTHRPTPTSGPSFTKIRKSYMAVGTGGGQGGGGGNCPPPPIFCQPKKFKSLKITTYKSVYSNKDKIGF